MTIDWCGNEWLGFLLHNTSSRTFSFANPSPV